MIFDPDCVRDVLLAVEALDFDGHYSIDSLHEAILRYSPEQLEYTCLVLENGGFLELTTVRLGGQNLPSVKSINGLTYKGHELLSNIRKDSIWTGVKSIATKVGATSLTALTQIASNVISEIIKAQFGLSSQGAV